MNDLTAPRTYQDVAQSIEEEVLSVSVPVIVQINELLDQPWGTQTERIIGLNTACKRAMVEDELFSLLDVQDLLLDHYKNLGQWGDNVKLVDGKLTFTRPRLG